MNANLTISEILTIVVVLLIVFGPQRLPEMARKLGEWVSKARQAFASVRDEFTREYGDITEPLSGIEQELRAAKDDLRRAVPTARDIDDVVKGKPAERQTADDRGTERQTTDDRDGRSAPVEGGNGQDGETVTDMEKRLDAAKDELRASGVAGPDEAAGSPNGRPATSPPPAVEPAGATDNPTDQFDEDERAE